MSALTNDRDTVRKEGKYASYPVKDGAVIYAGGMVCIGADGYAVPASDTAGLKFMGVARAYADNSAGVSGSLQVEVWRRGCFNLAASGMALSNAGDDVFCPGRPERRLDFCVHQPHQMRGHFRVRLRSQRLCRHQQNIRRKK